MTPMVIIDTSSITSNSDLVVSAMLAFIVGMVCVIVYNKLKDLRGNNKRGYYQTNEAIVEAVVLEYTRRLQDYDKAIAELRAKVDIMDMRSQVQGVQQPLASSQLHHQQEQSISREPQPHVSPKGEQAAITQQLQTPQQQLLQRAAPEAHRPDGQNGTTDYILKLLAERPRTSREVQHAIGRTREHTARLMKKLHDLGFVSRDGGSKPFRYSITDLGRERLVQRGGVETAALEM